MGPVVTAIDEGHYQKLVPPGEIVCRFDGEKMPCSRLVQAQSMQDAYATTLRHKAAVSSAALWAIPPRR